MFKPRLRIPRRTGLPRLSLSSAATTSPISPFAAAAARSIHAGPEKGTFQVPPLNHIAVLSSEGLKGLYSREGFETAFSLYQQWCCDELNRLTAGTNYEGKTVKELALVTSREPHLASIFNYASMSYNNHFFFESLATSGQQDPSEHMPLSLKTELEQSFGSLETLQRDMILTANAMFGPGFVWLVRQTDSYGAQRHPFRILTTYLAGSPFPAAHWRRQATDMNSQGGVTDRAGDTVRQYFDNQNQSNRRTALHGSSSSSAGGDAAGGSAEQSASALVRQKARNPGGADLIPVLCVNTWEHAWLMDWHVGGKFGFLAAWWGKINWGKVAERARQIGDKPMSAQPAAMPRAEAHQGS